MTASTPFLIGFEGTELQNETQHHLNKMAPAGVVLFKRNIKSLPQVKKLIIEIKDLLGDIIIAVDHEGGIVSRFPSDCPVPPSPRALRESGSLDVVRNACRIQAELVDYIGVNLNFVPVMDLVVYSANRVIGTRAYSSDPKETEVYGNICIEEHKKLGIGTSIKHFPGHGRTVQDTHYTVGEVLHDDRCSLDEDIYPFAQAIKAGVPTVMTSHLTYPFLDKQNPAELSRPIVTELLRNKLNFNGLVISDCVEMSGISDKNSPGQIVQKGMHAGMDLFISSFFLKKSYDFHLALKHGYETYKAEQKDALQWQQRHASFLQNYPIKKSHLSKKPTMEETLAIHAKTLSKVKETAIPREFDDYYLVELSNDKHDGIVADSKWNSVSNEIVKHCRKIAGSRLVYGCDIDSFQAAMRFCNEKKHTCVLITANGRFQKNYKEFIQILKSSLSAIHIAILDGEDLSGNSINEWVTWGYNACTGKMLAHALSNLV